VLENLGAPGLRELQARAAAGDRALCELTRRQQRDTLTVLRCLAVEGAYSVFTATANPDIAGTMDRIFRWGLVERSDRGFPWSDVRLTDKGRHLLAGMWAPPPRGKKGG
jgi:hypothetical protein